MEDIELNKKIAKIDALKRANAIVNVLDGRFTIVGMINRTTEKHFFVGREKFHYYDIHSIWNHAGEWNVLLS